MVAGSKFQDDGPAKVCDGERRSLDRRSTSVQERLPKDKPASGSEASTEYVRGGARLPSREAAHAFSQAIPRHLILAAAQYSAGKLSSDVGGGNGSAAHTAPASHMAFLAAITDVQRLCVGLTVSMRNKCHAGDRILSVW